MKCNPPNCQENAIGCDAAATAAMGQGADRENATTIRPIRDHIPRPIYHIRLAYRAPIYLSSWLERIAKQAPVPARRSLGRVVGKPDTCLKLSAGLIKSTDRALHDQVEGGHSQILCDGSRSLCRFLLNSWITAVVVGQVSSNLVLDPIRELYGGRLGSRCSTPGESACSSSKPTYPRGSLCPLPASPRGFRSH